MSTEQENFDDLLRSKLEEGDFAFSEANWDKAEALIIAAEKKRKRRRIAFIFFIGLLIGICLMFPFIGFEKNDAGKNATETNHVKNNRENKKPAYDDEVGTKHTNNNEEAATSQKNSDTKTKAESIKEPESNTNTEAENVKEPQNNAQVDENTTSSPIAETRSTLKKEKNAKAATTINNKPSKDNIENELLVPENENATAGKKPASKQQAGRSGEAKNNSKQTVSGDHAKANNTQPAEMQSAGSVKKEDLKTDVKNNVLQANNNNLQKDSITDTLTALKNSPAKDTLVTLKDSVAKTHADTIKPVTKDSAAKFKPITFFSIDAGASYGFGWANNSTKEAAGFNPVAGISASHYFTKKWSVLLGLQYNSLAHLNYSNYTSSNTQYSFGYSQSKTIITPTILKYLAIPVKLQYWFNDKNSLSIGVNILYLLNTSSKVETLTQSDFSTSAPAFTTKAGYRDGFANWDFQPALAYRRRIYKALSISAEVYYGLQDLKNNAVLGINKTEHNSGLKLTLSYHLFSK